MKHRNEKILTKHTINRVLLGRLGLQLILLMGPVLIANAGVRSIIELRDFTQVEVKNGGFNLPSDGIIQIRAVGAGGEKGTLFSKSTMFAYGWIINANTRELVWKMDRNNTQKENHDRRFDGEISLPKGSYEVYFSAYGYVSGTSLSAFDINIDRRKERSYGRNSKNRGFFGWFEEFFGDDIEKEWNQRAKEWGIELSVSDRMPDVTMFAAPKEFPRIVYKATKLGEDAHIRQQFTISKPTSLRIYALGEIDNSDNLADYGWIANAKTRKRVWQLQRGGPVPGGGAKKNRKFDAVIAFQPGEFTLYYVTDGSHSYVDWNQPPPEDPFNYGITLMVMDEESKANFKLTSSIPEEKNIIVQLIRITNDETRNESFSLKNDASVRIYALGEGTSSGRQMADYGCIVDARTRQRVWSMEFDRTEHAGGAEKNRMIDEVITLPKGNYTVFYQTDDSHAFDDWNDSSPFDPEHWGITITGEGAGFSLDKVDKNPSLQSGIIAQIVRVGDNANRTVAFKISKPAHVQVYAIGEGRDREMFDYGWIEETRSGNIVWEMTYGMTFHAGGDRKNRIVNTTILLDKGDYTLHYVADDSHSCDDWNTDPPDDQTMWGITLFEEQ